MSKENINLPKTSFSMKANLPNKEPQILKIWDEMHLYKKLREVRRGKEKVRSNGKNLWKKTTIRIKLFTSRKRKLKHVINRRFSIH